MTLIFDTSTLWLEISDTICTTAWQQSQGISIPGNRWQTYLNQVTDRVMRPWFQQTFGHAITHDATPIHQPEFWAMVNGSAITVGEHRFIVIPTETIDKREFWVPQEWIDSPSWVGDYYLAAEVNLDEGYLNVWGYTTHQALKTQGRYDGGDRAYGLSSNDIIQDLNALWVVYQLGAEPTQTPLPALPDLSEAQAQQLIQHLGNPTVALPRLDIPFAEWGALLAQPHWLQQLCQRRQDHNPAQRRDLSQVPVTLSRWFQNMVEPGWRALDELLGASPELAFGFREDPPTTEAVRRVKLIHLGAEDLAILLLVMLEAEPDNRIGIRVRLLPATGELLPVHLELILISQTGETLQSVQTREQDNSIQLKRFRCPAGTPFRLQVSIHETSVVEDFVS